MYKLLIFLLAISTPFSLAYAQDKVYYKNNKTDNWRVTEINPEYLKAVDANDSDVAYSTTSASVLFMFNKMGAFLVLPKLYDDKKSYETNIKNFFRRDKTIFQDFDKIITSDNNIIICSYQSVEGDKIRYTVEGKEQDISKSKVAVIIYKNGSHLLLTSVEKAFKTLGTVQAKYSELALAQPALPAIAQQQDPVASVTKGDTAGAPATQAAVIPVVNKQPAEKELEPSTVLKLQQKALVNIRQLGDYIIFICQKDSDPDDVTKTIDQALALFTNDAKIEVSSINRATVNQFRIKDYLIRLGYLKYQKVLIEWYNIQYTSVLRKGPDGFYYGTIEFEQKFVGISADNARYEDITRKSVEVVLRSYERHTGGETTMEWDVFLGDIGVTVTKPA